MKKVILVLAMLLTVSTTIIAKDVTINFDKDSVAYDLNTPRSEAERLVDKYSVKIEAFFVSIGNALKQPAEHVYKVLVKKQFLKGLGTLSIPFFAIIVLLIFIFSLKYCFKIDKIYEGRKNRMMDTYEAFIALPIISGILFIVLIGFTCNIFDDTLINLFNPEYGAIKEIMDYIK